MDQQAVIDLGIKAMIVAMKISAPALLSVMLSGLIISILQAATSINEQTLSFIPKIIAMSAALVIFGPWIMQVIISFSLEMFESIPKVTH